MNNKKINSAILLQALVLVGLAMQLIATFYPFTNRIGDPALLKFLSLDGYGTPLSNWQWRMVFFIGLFLGIFSSIGLFFFQNWGRLLFVILQIHVLMIALIMGIRVALPEQVVLGFLQTLNDGVILAIIYLTDISDRFKEHSSEPPALLESGKQ